MNWGWLLTLHPEQNLLSARHALRTWTTHSFARLSFGRRHSRLQRRAAQASSRWRQRPHIASVFLHPVLSLVWPTVYAQFHLTCGNWIDTYLLISQTMMFEGPRDGRKRNPFSKFVPDALLNLFPQKVCTAQEKPLYILTKSSVSTPVISIG